jgi:hypothetical protein
MDNVFTAPLTSIKETFLVRLFRRHDRLSYSMSTNAPMTREIPSSAWMRAPVTAHVRKHARCLRLRMSQVSEGTMGSGAVPPQQRGCKMPFAKDRLQKNVMLSHHVKERENVRFSEEHRENERGRIRDA